MEINELLQLTIDKQASDLHIITDYHPSIRINNNLLLLRDFGISTKDDCQRILFSILTSEQKEELLTNKEIDLGYDFHGNRFRVNIYHIKNNLAAAFRLIPLKIKTIEELKLPSVFHKFTQYQQGLVLITGPTGEGKSTTLASLINEINFASTRHIITIEDPIEYIYPQGRSIISQRELHIDTHSWNIALKSALREDPDVVLVGEMRDYETIQATLTLAETGHLVFSTLHTNSTPETINRIVDVFPSHQQNQIRNQLSSVLQVIVAQRLLPDINEKSRLPALEILVNTQPVSSVIREGKTFMIDNILETSEDQEMILFEKHLLKLFSQGLISKNTALTYALRPNEIKKFIT